MIGRNGPQGMREEMGDEDTGNLETGTKETKGKPKRKAAKAKRSPAKAKKPTKKPAKKSIKKSARAELIARTKRTGKQKRGEGIQINFLFSPTMLAVLETAANQMNVSRTEVLRLGLNFVRKAHGVKSPEALPSVRGRPPIHV
jgi:hypothetical protein